MTKHTKKNVAGQKKYVDMEGYFKKDNTPEAVEEERMAQLLKEIQDAESGLDEDFDEDLEYFKQSHTAQWDDD